MTTTRKTAKKKAATKRKSAKKPATKRTSTKKRAAKRSQADAPAVGTTLTREFKGTKHTVKVTADGYAHGGKTYRTLTAVAKAITGYASVSGPRFFGTADASTKGGKA